MKIQQLKKEFLALCMELKTRPDVLYTEVKENKKNCVFTMYFHAIRVDLVYCWKWESLAPPSILFSRFYLDKNVDLFLHLPELMVNLEAEDYRACYFPYIENTQRMEACFRALVQLVDDYIPAAEHIVQSGKADVLMKAWFESEFFNDQKEPDTSLQYDNIDQQDRMIALNYTFEFLMVNRHTEFPAYEAFQLGQWEKSLKLYRKQEKNGLSSYERGLIRFMEAPENHGFLSMPAECFSMPGYKKATRGVTNLLGIAATWGVFSILFCAIIAIYNAIRGSGTVYYFGAPAWFGISLGLLPALFGFGAFQTKILSWLGRKKELDIATMLDAHPVMNKLLMLLFAVSVAASMLFGFYILNMGDRFYEDHAICYRDEDAALHFDYDQIEDIYYIKARYNVYGDLVKRGSYVIALKDGTCIDLDGSADEKNQKEMVQALFGDFTVIEVETDRNLPSYTQPD